MNNGTAFCNDDDGPAPKLDRGSFCAFAGRFKSSVAQAISAFDPDNFKRPLYNTDPTPSGLLNDAAERIECYCYSEKSKYCSDKPGEKKSAAVKRYISTAKKSFDDWVSLYSQRSRYRIHGFSAYPIGTTQVISCKK